MIISSIDIGTNTVLLLVAEVNNSTKKIISLRDEHRIPRIGKNVTIGKPISNGKITELFEVLDEYNKINREFKSERTIVSATNAFRISSNGMEISKRIEKVFGWDVNILSGDDEAKYSYLGSTYGDHSNVNTLIIDIGGGSTELVLGRNENIFFRKSFPVGAVIATEKYLKHAPPLSKEVETFKEFVIKIFDNLMENVEDVKKSIAIAGTPTTLACIKQNISEYNESLIEGSELTKFDLVNLSDTLAAMPTNAIKTKYGNVVKGREDVLLSGSLILLYIMELLKLPSVLVSTKGIRYGAIVNYILDSKAN